MKLRAAIAFAMTDPPADWGEAGLKGPQVTTFHVEACNVTLQWQGHRDTGDRIRVINQDCISL